MTQVLTYSETDSITDTMSGKTDKDPYHCLFAQAGSHTML